MSKGKPLGGKKRKRWNGAIELEKRLTQQHEESKRYREELFAKLDPATREMARKEFAKLGLC